MVNIMPVISVANIDFMQILAILSLKMEVIACIIFVVIIISIVLFTIVFDTNTNFGYKNLVKNLMYF